MKLSGILIISILMTAKLHAQSTALTVADFINDSVSFQFINMKPSCRDSNNVFNEKLCSKNEYKCDLNKKFYWNKKVPLTITIDNGSKNLMPSSVNYLLISLDTQKASGAQKTKDSFKTSYGYDYPINAEIEIFATASSQNQVLLIPLGKYRVPNDGKIKITQVKEVNKKIRITTPEWLDVGDTLSIKTIGDIHLAHLGQQHFIDIYYPEDELELIANHYHAKEQVHKTAKLKLQLKNQTNDAKLIQKDFKTTQNTSINDIEWSPKSVTTNSISRDRFTIPQNSLNAENIIQKVNKIIIETKETKKEITNYFTTYPLGLNLKEDYDKIFQDTINDQEMFILKIEGTCEYDTYMPSRIEYPLFEKATKDSAKLGKITISIPRNFPSINATFKDSKNKETSIKGNFAHEICDNGADLAMLQWIQDKKNEYVNLGSGPWGNEAWSVIPTIQLDNSNYKFALAYKNSEFAKIKTVNGQKEIIHWNSEDESNHKSEVLNLTKLGMHEKNKITFKCNYN